MLYDDRLEGRISVTRFDLKNAETKRELELVNEKLSDLDSGSLRDPLEYARRILELGQKASGSERKLFLQSVLSNCTLRESKLAPTFSEPLAILADTNARWRQSGCVSTDLSAVSLFWYPRRDSNPSFRLRRPALYPTELQGHCD
jgi:hypothetical protein